MNNKIYSSLFLVCILFGACFGCGLEAFTYSTDRECNEKYFSNAFVFIGAYQQQYQYSFSPVLNYGRFDNKGYYYYLSSNVTYTLTWTLISGADKSCDGQETFTFDNPSVTLEQPKCSHSYGKINYNGPLDGILLDDGTTPASFPISSQASSDPVKLYFDQDTFLCPYNVKFYELSNKYPVYKIQNPVCGDSQGSVSLDTSKYRVAELYDQQSNKLASTGNGVWSGLKNQTYYFMLESDECGSQKVPFTLEQNIPSFNIEYKQNTCPTEKKAAINVGQWTAFSAKIDGQLVDPTNIDLKSSQLYTLSLSNSDCTFESSFNTPDVELDVKHIVTYPSNCLDPIKVDLVYNEAIITDLLVKNESDIIALTGKSFQYRGSSFSLESACYGTKKVFVQQSNGVVPEYSLTKKPQFAGDKLNVAILNAQSFESLKITNGANQVLPSAEGVFSDLTTYNYVLEYTTSACSGVQYLPLNFAMQVQDRHLVEQVDIIEYAGCGIKGKGSYSIKYTPLNIVSQPTIFEFDSSLVPISNTIQWDGSNQVVKSFKFTPPLLKRNDINVSITVVKGPTCAYSEDASIAIKSVVPIGKITIDGFIHLPTKASNSTHYIFINVPSGELVVTISLSSGCKFTKTVVVNPVNKFEFKYTATGVSDCSVSDGSIQVSNPSLYSELMINGKNILANGELTGLASDYQLVSFILTDNTCFGVAQVYIPTQVLATPVIKDINVPYCQQSNTGVVEFSLKSNTNQPMTLDSVVDYDSTTVYTNGRIEKLLPGSYKYLFKSGSCSWSAPHQVSSQDFQFSSNLLSSFVAGTCSQRTFTKISNDGIIEDIQFYDASGNKESESLGNGYFTYSDVDQASLGVNIYYGQDTCHKSIKITDYVAKSTLQRAFPEFAVSSNCSESYVYPQYTISASNPNNIPIRLGFSDPDSTGKWVVPLLFDSTITDPVTGCSSVSKLFVIDACLPDNNGKEKDKGINLGLVIGLTVGLTVGCALIAVAGYIVYKKKKRSSIGGTKLKNLS
ncbi:hypothetical protein CYY_007243 [Polysphondylium violaceum]|uniref:MRH domain-containing protein n=1 Tax=Polysphondylium violaceum TaxID=133409 RepID=A0A8J4PR87_9MYCE|nr:hypothetical protein CYY_007243 [Polysphondylium violaceum]